jgi:GT2 family glycosyltransferase
MVATAVVIVNYRTKEETRVAVESVVSEPDVSEVVIVDNASRDGSIEYLRQNVTDARVQIVESPTNVGFGQGINLGVEHCKAPLLLFLNSDAKVRPGSLACLTETLLGDDSIGVVAPAIYTADRPELQWGTYGVFPTLKAIVFRTNVNPPETVWPDWVSGVAMMLRRADFETVGGFDPGFMMYLEDVDLCRRLRGLGKGVRRELAAGVDHLLGGSWDRKAIDQGGVDARQVVRWAQDSRVRYYRKTESSRMGRVAVEGIRLGHLVIQRLPWRRSVMRMRRG